MTSNNNKATAKYTIRQLQKNPGNANSDNNNAKNISDIIKKDLMCKKNTIKHDNARRAPSHLLSPSHSLSPSIYCPLLCLF